MDDMSGKGGESRWDILPKIEKATVCKLKRELVLQLTWSRLILL